jgi:hypothetical protein
VLRETSQPTSRAEIAALRCRIRRLERTLLAAAATGVLAIAGCLAVREPDAPALDGERLLRVRGIVVEDAAGRPAIVLGADVAAVPGRVRTDSVRGLVLLSPEGRDVLQLGRVGGPQLGGTVQERVSPATGLAVADAQGDERAGFGLFDNGQAGWGLDFPDGEGLVALVDPARGLAGLVLQSPGEGATQRMLLLNSTEGARLELCDEQGRPRVHLGVPAAAAPKLEVLDADGRVGFDAFEPR